MATKQKNAVVTGGCGFIGSHLVDRLLADGHKVTAGDNFSNGRPENLARHKTNENLKVAQGDVADIEFSKTAIDGADWVFHLADLADIVPSIVDPLLYHHSNVDGTVSLLEAARHAGVEKFVYAASSTCYAIPDTYPTPENAPIQPMYSHAMTKKYRRTMRFALEPDLQLAGDFSQDV